MHFSRFAPAAAGLIGAAQALVPGLVGDVDLSGAKFDLDKSWEAETLFDGVVKAATDTEAAVQLGLNLKEAQIEGDISIGALENFLKEPTLRLDLAGVKAYVEIEVSATAAVYQTVQLIASPELSIDAGILDVDLGAAFALDLVVGVGAAIDLCAGFYVSFQEGDYLDLSIITKEVVGKKLDGLVTKALPIGLGAEVDLSAQIEVQLGLRLRSHVSIGAGVDLLGLDLLDAGAEVAIWADLLEHSITLVETDDCAVAVENEFGLSLGIAVEVSASVLDLLDISLAPEVTVTLAKALGLKVCMPDRGSHCGAGPGIEPPKGSGSIDLPSPTPSGSPSPSLAPNATITSGGLITSTATTTKTYTITSCHASVPNCPASHTQQIVTSTVISSVTVCPAESTGLPSPSSTPTSTKRPVHHITETLTTVVPCKPTTSTFTPPPGSSSVVPTVTISDSVTVCPSETGGENQPPAPTGVPSTEVPAPTTTPGFAPSSAPSSAPPPAPTTALVVPSWSQPPPNSTWTSLTPPGSTWVPPPSNTPGPSPPPTAGAGSIKVGFALALPAVIAMML